MASESGSLVSWLSSSGALVLVIQNHDTDCMRMLEHFFGRRFLLASFARQFQEGCGGAYYGLVGNVSPQIQKAGFASGYTNCGFILYLLPIFDPPARRGPEENVGGDISRP